MINAYGVSFNAVVIHGSSAPMVGGAYSCSIANVRINVENRNTPPARYLDLAIIIQALDAFEHSWQMPSMDFSLRVGDTLLATGRLSYMGF